MNLYRINDNGERVPFNVVTMPQRAKRLTPTPGIEITAPDYDHADPIPWAVPLAVHWMVAFALGVIVTAVVMR